MPSKKQPAGTVIRYSGRSMAQQSTRIIDEAAKRKRIQKHLETLEKDNFQEDPHANITWNKAAPKFEDELVFAGREEGTKKRRRKQNSPTKFTGAEHATKKGKKLIASLTKTRFRKSFGQLMEEAERKWDEESREASASGKRSGTGLLERDSSIPLLTYTQVTAQPSRFPSRKFCAVCGLIARYTCVKCTTRYCSLPCRDTHVDTRCLKWTV